MSARTVSITVDGRAVSVEPGTMLAAALLGHGVTAFRDSVAHSPRAPLCGMGICFECRVRVNGLDGVRSCLVECTAGMVIETGSVR